MDVKPFHAWKEEQVRKDSEAHGVGLSHRLRQWYFKAYGGYVQGQRKSLRGMTEEAFRKAHG